MSVNLQTMPGNVFSTVADARKNTFAECGSSKERLMAYISRIPSVFPNYLSSDVVQQRSYHSCWGVVLCLLILCLVPRMLIAFKTTGICPDGILYIRLATAFEEGRYSEAFEAMELNVYPVILMGLHRLGFDWEIGGAIWGVIVSSLVVLPLYCWVRRQFDDTTALTACLLYAIHPIFIQWSPELIRDPTFWLVFTASLYFLWRAIVEVRTDLSIVAGVMVSLAILTRIEGLFLYIPLAFWLFWRYRAIETRSDKKKLLVCCFTAALIFPAFIVAVNLILLRNHSQWMFARLAPLKLIPHWWNSLFQATANTAGTSANVQVHISFSKMLAIYVPPLVKGLSPLFAIPMLWGLFKWRGVWGRRDHQPLFYTALAFMTAAWIHAWAARESCDRYYLPIVLMASPFASLATLDISGKMLRAAKCLWSNAVFCRVAVIFPLFLIATVDFSVAFSGMFCRRAAELELATWIQGKFGSSAVICGSEGMTSVVAHYAKVKSEILTKDMDEEKIINRIKKCKPDVIFLLATRLKMTTVSGELLEAIRSMDYELIERSGLPSGTDNALIVLCHRKAVQKKVGETISALHDQKY
jgi:hypothetical protein